MWPAADCPRLSNFPALPISGAEVLWNVLVRHRWCDEEKRAVETLRGQAASGSCRPSRRRDLSGIGPVTGVVMAARPGSLADRRALFIGGLVIRAASSLDLRSQALLRGLRACRRRRVVFTAAGAAGQHSSSRGTSPGKALMVVDLASA